MAVLENVQKRPQTGLRHIPQQLSYETTALEKNYTQDSTTKRHPSHVQPKGGLAWQDTCPPPPPANSSIFFPNLGEHQGWMSAVVSGSTSKNPNNNDAIKSITDHLIMKVKR